MTPTNNTSIHNTNYTQNTHTHITQTHILNINRPKFQTQDLVINKSKHKQTKLKGIHKQIKANISR